VEDVLDTKEFATGKYTRVRIDVVKLLAMKGTRPEGAGEGGPSATAEGGAD